MTSEVTALKALQVAGARFILVGSYGANLHAMQVGMVITTLDCDVLIDPSPENLSACMNALEIAGFSFEVAGEPFVRRDLETLSRAVEMGANIKAVHETTQIDIMTHALDMNYSVLATRSKKFTVDGLTIPVAPLVDILRSKIKANRPKDRLFLAMYHDTLAKLGIKADPT